ncbi:MAG: hypothetical protein KAG53_09040, partial [Endozoicomonadaceae bacterium]|nr:hypothetical protein [Endozoicomonadaceae bacterium]
LETSSKGNIYRFLNKLRTILSKKLNPEPHSVFLSSGTVPAINKSRIQVLYLSLLITDRSIFKIKYFQSIYCMFLSEPQ